MKLDPEDQIIAAALDQAAVEEANERGVAARIEFPHERYAKVTVTISRELVNRARAWAPYKSFALGTCSKFPGALRRKGLAACPR